MKELELKFLQFCPHMSTRKKSILDMHLKLQNYIDLIESTGLLREDNVTVSETVTHRTIRECFIWAQRKTTSDKVSVQNEEESLKELGFYEFLESLVLMAHRVYGGDSVGDASELGSQLARLIDVLLAKSTRLKNRFQ